MSYIAKGLFKNGHFNTLFTHFRGQYEALPYKREAISHPLGFSLYLDWVKQGNEQLIVFSHGLESNSAARYIQTMGAAFLAQGFDVLAWNCRNCAVGEKYEKHAHYHSGISEDLNHVLEHVLSNNSYKNIVLVGFSMGANIMLKYVGEKSDAIAPSISACMAVSCPLDLEGCSQALLKFPNKLYGKNFLKTILQKVEAQEDEIRELGLSPSVLLKCKNLREFDRAFTAPVHGFVDEDDYYMKASALPLLTDIKIPTLLVSALDDPMLPSSCYPDKNRLDNPCISTHYTRHGGHVAFYDASNNKYGWLELQAMNFLIGPNNK